MSRISLDRTQADIQVKKSNICDGEPNLKYIYIYHRTVCDLTTSHKNNL